MGRCSSREEFRIFRILALDPITGRIRKGIPWNLVPFPILLLLSVPRSFCLVCNQNLVNSSKFWWTGLRGFARRHRPPAWQYNNLIRSHIHGKPSGRFPWGDHTGVHLMKTNSTFLRGWGIYRNDSKCRPHVARVVSSTTTLPRQTPGSSVFRSTKQLQRSPVIETNSIFLSPTRQLSPYYECTGAFLTRLF